MSIPIRVVILEDRAMDAELILFELRRSGFDPIWQRVDDEPGYLAALQIDPALILADWTLPQFSGLRALQLMQERGLDIPFVIVSGSIGEEVAVEAMRQGAADYLLKDRLTRLGQAVQRAMEDKQLRAERKRAEEALEHERALLRTVINNVPDYIWIKDATSHFMLGNNAVARSFGKAEASEIVGLCDFDCHAPELAQRFYAEEQELIRTGQPLINHEEIVIEPDGRTKWLSSTKVPLRGRSGDIEGIIGISRDITEHKQAEVEIRQRNEDLALLNAINAAANRGESLESIIHLISEETRRVFDSMGTTLYLLNENRDRLVMQNMALPPKMVARIEKLLRVSIPPIEHDLRVAHLFRQVLESKQGRLITELAQLQEFVGLYVDSAPFSEKVRAHIRALIPMLVKLLGEKSLVIVPLVSGDTAIGTLEMGSRGIFTAGDLHRFEAIAGQLTATIQRKRAEDERERLVAQIRGQARQTAQILATVPEGVLLVDAGGQVLQANPVAERDLATLAGVKVGEVITHLGDRPLADLLTSPPTRGLWHEVKADQRTFEVIARPVQSALGPDENGVEHWVLVINDVTQEREIRAQLQQQERLAAVGQLAAGIAHDFNNILAIIALHAPLVARAPGLTDHDRQRLQVISEQTTHATRLIQQLLDFSRRAELARRPLDLGPLLKEQVRLLARTLPETIAVTLECEPGEHVVLADPTRLQQMLMNLAVNARDAMPAGGALQLRLTRQETASRPGRPAGPWVRLEVADSGTGIPPQVLSHIFEPFFTTKSRGQGTGLGLAQVHGIVKQHDGEIVVHSPPGQGVTFTIYLPIVAGIAPAVAVPEVVAQQGNGERILIVEDNAALLNAMSDIVEMLGYDVVSASNGAEALAMLEAPGNAIALVLSDLVMPVMGGEALLAAIQARELAVPMVMLSGHPLESELEELKAHGLAGWLLKPPDVDQLARLLAQTLAR